MGNFLERILTRMSVTDEDDFDDEDDFKSANDDLTYTSPF